MNEQEPFDTAQDKQQKVDQIVPTPQFLPIRNWIYIITVVTIVFFLIIALGDGSPASSQNLKGFGFYAFYVVIISTSRYIWWLFKKSNYSNKTKHKRLTIIFLVLGVSFFILPGATLFPAYIGVIVILNALLYKPLITLLLIPIVLLIIWKMKKRLS